MESVAGGGGRTFYILQIYIVYLLHMKHGIENRCGEAGLARWVSYHLYGWLFINQANALSSGSSVCDMKTNYSTKIVVIL